MNRRRELLIALAATALAPLRARAQPATRVYRIGYLSTGSANDPAIVRLWQSLLQRLSELGYAENKNLIVERRFAEGRVERLPALAKELVAARVDLIVAGTDLAALAAREHTSTIPIVFAAAGDPVGIKLVQSLARPGGNVTGFASFTVVVIGKQLELLLEVVPRLERLAVIYSPRAAAFALQMSAVHTSTTSLKLRVSLHDIENNLDAALRAAEQERPEALLVLPSVSTFVNRTRIIEFAASRRLPAVYGLSEYVESGGLMSYSFSYADNFRRSADYVDRIFKGAKPADLPVQQPTTLEPVVNLKTAKALGVTIPPSVLLRADRVIE